MTEAARLLRHARKRAGLTQRALAARAGVPQPYVARVESSKVDPSVSSLSRLLRACETTLEAMPGSGAGIDRTAMRALLRLSPADRFRPAARHAALRALHDAGVRFVLAGGLAARVHGSPTVPNALDVCYDRDPGNLERLAAALTAMHARPRGAAEDVLDALREGDSIMFDTGFGAVDVRATPPGTSGYADLMAGADPMDLGGFVVHVAALDDLIRVERAAARPTDRGEVEVLVALRDEITERS